MATKNATFTLNQNETQTAVTSRAVISGRTVYGDSITESEVITQNAGEPPVPKVWVKPGENSVNFFNNSAFPTTAFSFVVYVDNSTAFNAMTSTSLPAGDEVAMSGTRSAVSGVSHYTLHAVWNGEETGDNTTIIRWKENGVQKEAYGSMTYDYTTDEYYISVDTELSDFEVEIQQYRDTDLQFDTDSSARFYGGQRIQNPIYVTTLTVLFQWYDSSTEEYNEYEYVWELDANISMNDYRIADSPISGPSPDYIETSNPGPLELTIQSITVEYNGIPSNIGVNAEVAMINMGDDAITFPLDVTSGVATLPPQYQNTVVVSVPEGDVGTVYDPQIRIFFE